MLEEADAGKGVSTGLTLGFAVGASASDGAIAGVEGLESSGAGAAAAAAFEAAQYSVRA